MNKIVQDATKILFVIKLLNLMTHRSEYDEILLMEKLLFTIVENFGLEKLS
jgi:hypothetical protein